MRNSKYFIVGFVVLFVLLCACYYLKFDGIMGVILVLMLLDGLYIIIAPYVFRFIDKHFPGKGK